MPFKMSSSCEFPTNHAFLPNFSSKASCVNLPWTYSELVYACFRALFHRSSSSGLSSSLVGFVFSGASISS